MSNLKLFCDFFWLCNLYSKKIQATYQEGLVELKQTGELFEQLVNTVQPLKEDRTLLAYVVRVFLMSTAIPKFMPKVQPLGLNKQLESL